MRGMRTVAILLKYSRCFCIYKILYLVAAAWVYEKETPHIMRINGIGVLFIL